MALHDDKCWLDLNGWGDVEYSSEEERAEECRHLRRIASGGDSLGTALGLTYGCAIHYGKQQVTPSPAL